MSLSGSMRNALFALAETVVVRALREIQHGKLILRTPTRTYIFPEDHNVRQNARSIHAALIHVHSPNFFFRLLVSGDLGFAEAYMFGEVTIDARDLVQTFLIFIDNRESLTGLASSPVAKLLALPAAVIKGLLSPVTSIVGLTATRLANSLVNARANISAHYDLGNEMFRGFLSEDMTYSCAIFPTLDADLASPPSTPVIGSDTSEDRCPSSLSSTTVISAERHHSGKDELYDAQLTKLRHIIRKADIRPGHRVLEIGSGWGSLSLMIAQSTPGTVIDTITLSEQQFEHVKEKIDTTLDCDPNIKRRLRVYLMDYRSMPPEWEGAFDRVVSVEMVEAVGHEYLETYFAAIDWALKKDTGVGIVQGITIPESRYDEYKRSEDFIRKWVIFPGGILPTVTLLANAISQGSQQRLVVDCIENIGPHYARTLREWRRRFEGAFGKGGVIEEALRKEHPDIMSGPDGQDAIEVFRRKWTYYFSYCEAGFTTRLLGDHIITFTREGNIEYGCQVFV